MKTESEIQEEIETNIRMAANPSGDSTSLRERGQAARLLVEHGKIAHDRLMQLIQHKPESLEAPRLIGIFIPRRRINQGAP